MEGVCVRREIEAIRDVRSLIARRSDDVDRIGLFDMVRESEAGLMMASRLLSVGVLDPEDFDLADFFVVDGQSVEQAGSVPAIREIPTFDTNALLSTVRNQVASGLGLAPKVRVFRTGFSRKSRENRDFKPMLRFRRYARRNWVLWPGGRLGQDGGQKPRFHGIFA